MEPSESIDTPDVALEHKKTHDKIIRLAKDIDIDYDMEVASDEGEGPSLFSDETVVNITYEQIKEYEEGIKKSFKRHLDISTLERPGICLIFPREDYKFEPSQEYIASEKYQYYLWSLAEKVYKFKNQILTDVKLPKDYEDKYVKFEYLRGDQLHKYVSMDEDEYLEKGMHKKMKFTLLSTHGQGLTYKMWKTNARLIRSILDLHGFEQIAGFECSILWTNTVAKRHMFNGFNDYQWVNHFPCSYEITRKMDLFKNFAIMQNKFKKKEYNYCPDTFLIPEEAIKFKDHLEKLKESSEYNEKKLWIVKPNKLSRGRGIYLIKDFAQLDPKEPGVVSEYVDNPLTVNGHKFDLRIYVVVTSFYPLRIYVYREGLARFATEKYSKEAAGSNLFVHLTNYSINKKNKGFDGKRKMADDTLPFKWSITAFFLRLQKLGIDPELIWEQIYDLIIKSILSSERYISYYTKDNFKKINRSFEIFGYDVMIDDKLKPWLMEINLSPSLSLESNMDVKLKIRLVTEMFNLFGFRKLSTAKEFEGTAYDAEKQPEAPSDKPENLQDMPKHKSKNLKFIDPDLTSEQRDQICELIENDTSIPPQDKEKMTILASSPHLNNITEVLSEYTRKEDFIRIFPAKGSDAYFKFFKYDLDVNKKLYEFLY